MKERIAIFMIDILGALPLSARRSLGKCMGKMVGIFARREREISELQLQKMLRTDKPQLITAKMFQFFSINLLETLNLFPILNQHQSQIRVNNPELWEDLMNYPQPIVALTGHTGNWDLLAAYVVKRGGKLMTMGRMARNPTVQTLLKYLREKYQIKTIWRKSLKDLREFFIESSKGTIMAVLVDQDIKARGVNTNFFNYPCKTSTALLELGLKLNARIVSAFMFQEDDGSYQLYLNEISKDQSTVEILNQYQIDLENLLRNYPEQWVWFHKRWRTVPKDDGSLYTMSNREYLSFLKEIK